MTYGLYQIEFGDRLVWVVPQHSGGEQSMNRILRWKVVTTEADHL